MALPTYNFACVLATVLALAIAGCGGSDEDEQHSGSFVKGQKCQTENEAAYRTAGFTCQASGAESCIYTEFGTNCVPILVLFPLNADGTVGAAKERGIPLETATSKLLGRLEDAPPGKYEATCRPRSETVATCAFRGTGEAEGCMGTGVVREREGRVAAAPSAVSGCERGTSSPPSAQAPRAAAQDLIGTYVCVTGILAQVREAGPTEIAPIEVPETGIEPPLKFVLHPDGTYANITFGKAYENDPDWKGTYRVDGDVVRLFTPNGDLLMTHPLLHRTDVEGTHYLIEDAPENDRYRANVCRGIA